MMVEMGVDPVMSHRAHMKVFGPKSYLDSKWDNNFENFAQDTNILRSH